MKNKPVLRWLLLLPLMLFLGCEQITWKRAYYPNGRPSEEQAFLVLPGNRLVPHGFHWTWYPDGTRRSLDIFVQGKREGYSFRWSPQDSLIRLDYCSDGQCEPRIVSGGEIASTFN